MFVATEIPDVILFTPKRHADDRGWFSETYNEQAHAAAFGGVRFTQDNHSCSRRLGTLRGLHFQTPPRAQDKLVRVLRGAVIDVAVDIRVGSPTFGKHVARTLSAENGAQLFVPKGFAHGFLTLEPDTEVAYKVSDGYAPANEGCLLWSDPALAIDWPDLGVPYTIAERDAAAPTLAALPPHFHHET
jgi:dTDP-4-dehydrorhamnose 3,5-epimerase